MKRLNDLEQIRCIEAKTQSLLQKLRLVKSKKNNLTDTCHPEQHERRMKASAYPFNASADDSGSEFSATNPPQPSLKKGGSRRAFPRPLRLCRAKQLSIVLREVRARVRGINPPSLCDTSLTREVKKAAFTLAEVLITLTIIGVVAAIVMPTLNANIQDKVREKRIQNIKQKFSKATDKMLVTSGLNNYGSTEAFVKELQKHLKIAKVCDNSNIAKCWPYSTVKLDDGKEWEISKTKTGKTLKMKNDDNHEWDDTMAFITADGTSFIISYDKKCNQDERITWGGDQSTSTNCTAMVFDWNGSSKPNSFSSNLEKPRDVIAFNAEGLGTSCAIEVNDKCFGAPFTPTPLTKAECEELKGSLGINACYYDNDYWAGAAKECGGTSKMATADDLAKIASLLYEGNPSIGAREDKSSLTYNGKASQLGFPEPCFYVWSGEEYSSDYAYYRLFYSTATGWDSYYGRNGSYHLGLCLGD